MANLTKECPVTTRPVSVAPVAVPPVDREAVDPKELPHPPGPFNMLQWVGLTWRHAAEFWLSPLRYTTKLARRYGDLTTFTLFAQRAYLVNHPDLIHEYLVRRRDDYIRAPWEMRVLRQLVGNGILTSEGELWIRQRRIIQQAFRGSLIPRYADLAVTTAKECLASWHQGEPVDLVDSMAGLMMDLSVRSTTGLNPAELGGPSPAEMSAAVVEGSHQMSREMGIPIKTPDWLPTAGRRKKRRAISTIDAYIRKAIEVRRADPDRYHDLLAVLLRAVDEEGDGKGMSDRQARDEAATMLVASAHSTSSTLGWFWKLVLARPRLHEQLVEEVDQVLGERNATISDVPRLVRITQTLKETMRLYPPAYVLFARSPIRDTPLGGYRVCRGSWMITMPWVTHRDPRFFDDPLTFDPDRFSPERESQIPKGAYFPFGHGPRICIGQHLAMTQLPLIVATILQNCTIEPEPGFDDMTIHREIAMRPAKPCRAIPRERDRWQAPSQPR